MKSEWYNLHRYDCTHGALAEGGIHATQSTRCNRNDLVRTVQFATMRSAVSVCTATAILTLQRPFARRARRVAAWRVGVWAVDTSLRQIITTVHSGHLSRVSRSAIRQRWHQKYLFTAHRHVKWNGISSIKINRYCIRIKLLRILEGTLPHRSRQVRTVKCTEMYLVKISLAKDWIHLQIVSLITRVIIISQDLESGSALFSHTDQVFTVRHYYCTSTSICLRFLLLVGIPTTYLFRGYTFILWALGLPWWGWYSCFALFHPVPPRLWWSSFSRCFWSKLLHI